MKSKSLSVFLRSIVGLFILVLWGCGGGDGGGGGIGNPNFNLAARVIGVITDVEGRGLGLVTVRVTAFARGSECAVQPLAAPVEVDTGEEGEYALSVTFTGSEEFDACLTIEAIPASELGLQPQSSSRQVEVRPIAEGIETIQVNFTLIP